MVVVFYIFVDKRDSCMTSIAICPAMPKHWNCDTNDLFAITKENRSSSVLVRIDSLEKIILQMFGIEEDAFSKL